MGYILMPQMGFDMQEGKLVRWLKKVGDRVERNEPVAEIETDKAVMEIESFEAGTITRLLAEEGQEVPVGTPIAELDGGDGEAAATPAQTEAAGEVPPAAGPAVTAEPSPAEEPASRPATAAPAGETTEEPADGETVSGRIKASPIARRLARELGVDLRGITGSGPGGRIVKADVEAAAAARPAAPVPAAPAPAAVATPVAPAAPAVAAAPEGAPVPLSRMRQVIATRMAESKQQAPHFYVSMSVDMGEALAFRKQFNATVGEEGRISINDLVVKACALALRAYPNLNASFEGDAIRLYDRADIAIAVAVEGGLITPVIRGCDEKFLGDIGAEARELAAAARTGRLRPDQYQGGTFTVSNLGMYGVEDFVAIINPPQAAILAVGAVTDTPVVRDGAVTIRPMMRITVSADHRVTDGAEAAQFLGEVKAILEQPLRLLMPAPRAKEAKGQ